MISNDIKYIGVTDTHIDLFEGQFKVPEGMLYNSYLINDLKIAVLDTVDAHFTHQWFKNLRDNLNGREPSYLIVSHMEPDHSAGIKEFMDLYRHTQIVASAGAFNMMRNIFGTDFEDRKIIAKENDKLELGRHTLTFIMAPNVHWPEVMFTFDSHDNILFSADAFGKFGSSMLVENWDDEARRYYFGIVGKFGANVQNILKKVSTLRIEAICPLHGPVLASDLGHYLALYNTWSSYTPESNGVTICYTSVYGHTKEAITYLHNYLVSHNVNVELYDLARDSMDEALTSAFKNKNLILATTTYNGSIFPYMKTFINTLIDHNYQNRKVFLIENGMWAPTANKEMKALLEPLKNITYSENLITLKGAFTNNVKEQLDKILSEL